MLFFKIFSDLDEELELTDDDYVSPIPDALRWSDWANEDVLGKDAPTGDALLNLVETRLFPQLKSLDLEAFSGRQRARAVLLRAVFEDAFNYMKSGQLLRTVVNKINAEIDFNNATTRHLFGEIYEKILRDLQSAGNAGEYYTPRAVTQFAVDMVNPQPGERIFDPACGTGGFLTCAYEHVKAQVKGDAAAIARLKRDILGVEKKPLPHLLCVTNMMVHGIEDPVGVRHDNTLRKPLRDYGPADEVDVVVTNPPFGGMEEDGIENNFPSDFRTRETADLFLVLVMELLRDGGRAAVVLPDGTLFGEGVKTRIKERLLAECNLHTIVRLPKGVFAPYTSIKTNVLFFEKGRPTTEVWYYEHPYPAGYKSYSKTKPMRIAEFDAEKAWWDNRVESELAWKVGIDEIRERGFNLDISNPNAPGTTHEDPDDLLARFEKERAAVASLREELRQVLGAALAGGAA